MNRHCFTFRIAPGHVAEYRRRHAAVWPEMLAALRDSGWRNYSIFVSDDGLVVGYFETDLPRETVIENMARTDVNARWQRDMAEFVAGGSGTPEDALAFHAEAFNLETQLGDA